MTDVTLNVYLEAMERIFLTENLPAWNPHLRSKTRLTKASKWQFADPSVATASLRASSDAILNDHEFFGLLFESLCVRDLRVYSQPIDGTLSYFRSKNGHEVDLILELPGGEWGAIEAKLGGKYIDEGAENLLKLYDDVDTDNMKRPSFLMVLTAGQFAYERPDGVLVVPVGCLRD
jgi:predicted AAA+ superfamily ATPase